MQRSPKIQGPVDIIQNDPEAPVGVFEALLAEWEVPFRLVRADLGEELPVAKNALIILGGAMGVHDEADHPFLIKVKERMRRALDAAVPLFGICLGGQLLAEVAGGMVSSNRGGEKGLVEVTLTAAGADDHLFAGVAKSFQAFQWHNDSFTVPPSAVRLAGSAACPAQAFRIGNAWGVQFHPEVDDSIVAVWSRRDESRLRLTSEFAAGEQAHRQLARLLLGNFLAQVGIPLAEYHPARS